MKIVKMECKEHKTGSCFLWYLYESKNYIIAVCSQCENDQEYARTIIPLKDWR